MNGISTLTLVLQLNAVLLCVMNFVFTFVGIFLNFVVILSFLSSQLRRKLCYFMILILACFDLVVAVVFHPLITFVIICDLVFPSLARDNILLYFCHLFAFSLIALLTMALERYLALVYPFVHEKFITRSRLMAIFVIFQLPFGAIHAYEVINSKHIIALEFALILAALLVIFCLNVKLFYIAKTLQHRMVIPLGSLNEYEQRNIQGKKRKFSSGRISACLLAVVCLFVCYLPTFVFFGLELTKPEDWSGQSRRIIELWSWTFVTLNSSLNCLIFFYKNSVLRRHGEKVVAKCLCTWVRFIVLQNRENCLKFTTETSECSWRRWTLLDWYSLIVSNRLGHGLFLTDTACTNEVLTEEENANWWLTASISSVNKLVYEIVYGLICSHQQGRNLRGNFRRGGSAYS